MELIEALLLGLLQGLTEFLPVSSSGHLALARAFFDIELSTGVVFEIVVHFGTLCSILIYYRETILSIIKSLPLWLKPAQAMQHPQSSMVAFVLISMIPAMIVALFFKDTIEAYFANPVFVCLMLLVTGSILMGTRFLEDGANPLNASRSFGIGLAQAFAILPGISRSGSTISAALLLGMKKEDAANFSFLMVIPVIGGAMILAVKDLLESGEAAAAAFPLAIGFFASFLSGYLALRLLIGLLKSRGIYPFAYYCWLLGGIGLGYLLF